MIKYRKLTQQCGIMITQIISDYQGKPYAIEELTPVLIPKLDLSLYLSNLYQVW